MLLSAPVQPFDWQRMLVGDESWLFLLEIVFRTAVVFGWLVLLLRLTGKRGLAQLSALELAIVIALGSAAGDPMFYPEVPLLHAMLVLAVVVGLQWGLSRLVARNEVVETFIEGTPVELIRSGVLLLPGLKRAELSREDLAERLRAQGVRQLGAVQRAYFEQDGALSVFCAPGDPPPGLPIVPPWDLEPPRVLDESGAWPTPVACLNCGAVRPGPEAREQPGCPVCGEQRWTVAVSDPLAAGPLAADPLTTQG